MRLSKSYHCKQILFFIILSSIGILLSYFRLFNEFKLNEVIPELRDEHRCILPNLEPWSKEVTPWVVKPEPLNCTRRFSRLFDSNLTSIIPINTGIFKKRGIESCCYRGIIRPKGQDFKIQYTVACNQLSLDQDTAVLQEPDYEFIAIECVKLKRNKSIYMDMHTFPLNSLFRAKRKLEKQKLKHNLTGNGGEKLNVLIFGFDSQSRMNFLRMMPESYDFIMKNLSAIEMKGFNRVGPYTHENEPPMFASKHPDELTNDCASATQRLDNCPFIWKKYSEQGYLTGLGEDTQSTFHIEFKGFMDPPVDFYLRPFMLAAQRQIASEKRIVFNLCIGPRMWYQVLLDYLKKIIEATKLMDAPLFFSAWANGLAHDDVGYLSLGDKPLVSLLKHFKDSNYLNNTVLILVGDHGIEYGEIRNTRAGNMEANLPLLFYVLPPWFPKKYPKEYHNMQRNSNQLTAAFDFYETLANLLNLNKIHHEKYYHKPNSSSKPETASRGISLFSTIASNRTCEDAGIAKFYCSCNRKTKPLSVDDLEVRRAAKFVVQDINIRLKLHWMRCAKLYLKKILTAERRYSLDGNVEDGLVLTVLTIPGRAIFEAVVSVTGETITLEKDTYRINPYTNQSNCVQSRATKMFCFCKKRINSFF